MSQHHFFHPKQYSYLVLPYVRMQQRGNIADFAAALAKMHRQIQTQTPPHRQFGFDHDNYIGKTPQMNQWNNNWGQFFSEQRIGYQLDLLQRQQVSSRLINRGRLLLPKLAEYLNRHDPKPALVHGDLWQGNFSFDHTGEPVIYDPACYYADHEVDLAMLELFGDPGEAFFTAYHRINPIDSGYSKRRKIYNLYHILNHANFFAGSYLEQSARMIDELLVEI